MATRRAYSQALAQRNALLSRVRRGLASRESLGAWDREVARHGIALRADRSAAVASLVEPFTVAAAELGLTGAARLEERPRARAATADELAEELAEPAVDADLERGFTGRGPHRDDLALLRDDRELRAYGSQGEQRLALLALLIAEREALGAARGGPPLLLLDDVMSELDAARRERLLERVTAGPRSGDSPDSSSAGPGQALITTTDLAHVPGATGAGVTRIAVRDGAVLQEAAAA